MKTKVSDSGGVLLDFQQLDQADRHRQRIIFVFAIFIVVIGIIVNTITNIVISCLAIFLLNSSNSNLAGGVSLDFQQFGGTNTGQCLILLFNVSIKSIQVKALNELN